MILKELAEAYEEALQKDDFNTIGEIISLLNNEPVDKKREAKELYLKIEEDLFSKSRSINNLDSSKFLKAILDGDPKEKVVDNKTATKVPVKIDDDGFDESLNNFWYRNSGIFARLKDYYVFKCETAGATGKPDVLILCDEDSCNRPELLKLEKDTVLKCHKKTVKEVIQSQEKAEEQTPRNYICILCLTPSLKEDENFKSDIIALFEIFDSAYYLSITTDKNCALEGYKIEKVDQNTFNTISESNNKVFNNSKLTFQEQRIIKRFFGSPSAVLDYKVLKPGASGSGVIEVQGIFTKAKETKRYVIKYARKEKNEPSKLILEKRQFEDSVEHFSNGSYSARYESTETHEAIKYNYASTDSITDSYSFFECLEKQVKVSGDLRDLINSLFNCQLVVSWNTLTPIHKKSSLFYTSYLKNEDKVIKSISEIQNLSTIEVKASSLIKHFEAIKDYPLSTYEKICHGDLHSENFFWDGKEVYLIDFGFTRMHHAVVDHTSLEASIRLKHFPRYIPLQELLDYEAKFLDMKSFEPDFDLSFIKRDNLRELYQLIHQIRVDSKRYFRDKTSAKEYLISLFFITFRQIQYHDLNQLYALNLANLLAQKLNDDILS